MVGFVVSSTNGCNDPKDLLSSRQLQPLEWTCISVRGIVWGCLQQSDQQLCPCRNGLLWGGWRGWQFPSLRQGIDTLSILKVSLILFFSTMNIFSSTATTINKSVFLGSNLCDEWSPLRRKSSRKQTILPSPLTRTCKVFLFKSV